MTPLHQCLFCRSLPSQLEFDVSICETKSHKQRREMKVSEVEAMATERPMIHWKFSQRVHIQRIFPKSRKHSLRIYPDIDNRLLVFELPLTENAIHFVT